MALLLSISSASSSSSCSNSTGLEKLAFVFFFLSFRTPEADDSKLTFLLGSIGSFLAN